MARRKKIVITRSRDNPVTQGKKVLWPTKEKKKGGCRGKCLKEKGEVFVRRGRGTRFRARRKTEGERKESTGRTHDLIPAIKKGDDG